jgi:hypothetical protein
VFDRRDAGLDCGKDPLDAVRVRRHLEAVTGGLLRRDLGVIRKDAVAGLR